MKKLVAALFIALLSSSAIAKSVSVPEGGISDGLKIMGDGSA